MALDPDIARLLLQKREDPEHQRPGDVEMPVEAARNAHEREIFVFTPKGQRDEVDEVEDLTIMTARELISARL